MRKNIETTDNKDWRAKRAKLGIGASAIGILLGESPFVTLAEYVDRAKAELRGEFDYTETMPMMRGHAYESGVAYLFERMSGHKVIKASAREFITIDDTKPYIHCSIDRTYWIDEDGLKHGKNAEANKGVLECKTTRMPIDPESLPTSWLWQIQVQMGLGGYSEGYLAWDVLSIPDGFGYKKFTFDQKVFDAACILAEDVWNKYILGNQIPPVQKSRDVARIYPSPVTGKTITANNDLLERISCLAKAKADLAEQKNKLDELEESIKKLFTDEEAIVTIDGTPLATYKATKGRTTIDSQKLNAEFPDAYDACKKVGASTRTFKLTNKVSV